MVCRALTILVVAAVALAQTAAGQDAKAAPEHKEDHMLSYSPFHSTYGTYSPIGSDKTNVYYRIRIRMRVTEIFRSSPLAPNPALTQAAASGNVFDFDTDTQVGSFAATSTAINNPAAPGASLYMISNLNIALDTGARSDSLAVTGGVTFNASEQRPTGSSLAIVGGTGRFTGAMGEFVGQNGSLLDAGEVEGVLLIAVPYYKPL